MSDPSTNILPGDPPPPRNFFGLEEDTPLWRVLKADHLLKMLTQRELVLVKPRKWEDPFENVLQRMTASMPDGRVVGIFDLLDNFYGLCWTDQEAETDATWRINMPDKTARGIRVKTTARRLFDCIYNAQDPFSAMSCFVGKVNYLSEQDIIQALANDNAVGELVLDGTGQRTAAALFIKRTEFSHESEVRLLYRDLHKKNSNPDDYLFRFPVDPLALIDEAVFDPRLKPEEVADTEQGLRAAGFTAPIRQSKLYQLPRLRFTIRT